MGVCGLGYKRDVINNRPFVLCLKHRLVLFLLFFLPDSAMSGETKSADPERVDANSSRIS